MDAHITTPTSVQIRDKNIRIAIKSMDGSEKLGEIVFNPDDNKTYEKFVNLMVALKEGNDSAKDNDVTPEDAKKLEENNLETMADLDAALEIVHRMDGAFKATIEAWENVCAGLDDLFGQGVCQIFTQGQMDEELLIPLIDVVSPHFKQSRDKKTSKYKA